LNRRFEGSPWGWPNQRHNANFIIANLRKAATMLDLIEVIARKSIKSWESN